MANAAVRVYYLPANPPETLAPDLIAQGRTDSSGVFSKTLSVGSVNEVLGFDQGSVQNLFNGLVRAISQEKSWLVHRDIILKKDSQTTATITANLDLLAAYPSAPNENENDLVSIASMTRNPSASDPDGGDPRDPILQPDGGAATIEPAVITNETRRWQPWLNWHIASGMKSTYYYLTGRTTRTQIAVKLSGQNWQVGGMILEETDRGASSQLTRTGPYHNRRYVRYRWYLYALCPGRGPCTSEWRSNHWTGGDDRYEGPIAQAAFDARYAELLGNATKTRYQNANVTYGNWIDIAGVSLDTRAGYATNTKVSWTRVTGCADTRYLYGNGADWTVAPVVLATCR